MTEWTPAICTLVLYLPAGRYSPVGEIRQLKWSASNTKEGNWSVEYGTDHSPTQSHLTTCLYIVMTGRVISTEGTGQNAT